MRRITIGIDEVGRGALAGPVVLAGVLISGSVRWSHPTLGRIRDSKKLTPRMREMWFSHLTAHSGIQWRVTRVSPRIIDRINISQAANLGALRLVQRLSLVISHLPSPLSADSRRPGSLAPFVWLDGGLVLPDAIPHKALIRGDERKPIIAAASIIAKVWRDRAMKKLARRIPEYGFEIHKGYGTRGHLAAIAIRGPSFVHRNSFAPMSLRIREG